MGQFLVLQDGISQGTFEAKDQDAADMYIADNFGDGFSAVPLEDGRKIRGEDEKATMDANIIDARIKAEKEERPVISKLYPTALREAGETDEGYGTGTATDVFSLLGRYGVSPDWEGTGMDVPWNERKGIERVVTSPVTGASLMAAPVAAGVAAASSWPMLTGALMEGGTSIGAGLSMDPDYGGSDIGIDAGASTIPALGPVIRGLVKNAAIKKIMEVLGKKGLKIDEAQANDIYAKTVNTIDSPKTSGNKIITEGAESLKDDIAEMPLKKVLDAEDEVLRAIDRTVAKRGTPEGRTIADANRAKSRVESFFKDLGALDAAVQKSEKWGSLEAMAPGAYREHIVDLMKDYSDVPELLKAIQFRMGATSNSSVSKLLSEFAADPSKMSEFQYSDWTPGISKIEAGDAIRSGSLSKYEPGPIESEYPLLAKIGRSATSPRKMLVASVLADAGLNFLPQYQRAAMNEE